MGIGVLRRAGRNSPWPSIQRPDAGRAQLEAASETHIAGVREVFEQRFSEAELGQLAELLSRLPGTTGAHGEDCAAP